jgi:hypothetical protein
VETGIMGQNNVIIGNNTYGEINNSVAVGYNLQVKNENVAIGKGSYTDTEKSIAIGCNAKIK